MAGRDTEAYGTILDYIRWRGDLDFERDPWNDIDSLILSQLCYANFGENERTFATAASVLYPPRFHAISYISFARYRSFSTPVPV